MNPLSYHIFLFPFRWYGKNIADFTKNLNTENIWDEDFFEVNPNDRENGYLNYNEQVYFYDFVKDAIHWNAKNQKNIAAYKLKPTHNNPKYRINHFRKDNKTENLILKDGKPKEFVYELDIEKIELKVYDTNIGILAFFLQNNNLEQSTLEHILAINEFGRRIFTPFYTKGFDLNETKKSLLAHEIVVKINANEDLIYKHAFGENVQTQERIPKYLTELLGENFHDIKDNAAPDSIKIKPALDDRMFVISWHQSDLAFDLQTKEETNQYSYLNSNDWYKYIFIDKNSPSCANADMLPEIIKKHSYTRWVGKEYKYPQIYGISRYSFVALSSDDFILNHLKTLYYKMVVLSLMQRASILRFSDEVTQISKFLDNESSPLAQIKELNKAYLKFTNQMYFREVTAQEQGIELYDMIQHHMRIERDVKDLNREIDELYQFARLLEDETERKQMNKMQQWGAVILIPTLVAGIFGMNTFPENSISKVSWLIMSLAAIGLSGLITWIIITRKQNK